MNPRRLGLACLGLLAACRAEPPSSTDAGVDASRVADVATEGPPPYPSQVRVATFNVHRFFDPTCDSGRCGAGDYEELPSRADFARRADELARAIERLDADVVLLQEVETDAALRAISERLGAAWPTAVLGETGAPASVDVAVVSRDALRAVRSHRDRALRRPDGTATVFSRDLLEVELDHAGRPVIAFAVHLRSRVDDDPGRRLAEAQAAHEVAVARAQERPDAMVLLGGDCNDVPGSPPLEALEADGALERATRRTPDAEAVTYVFRGEGLALDHLFRARDGAGEAAPAEVGVRWDAAPARGYGGSDHASLRAVYRW